MASEKETQATEETQESATESNVTSISQDASSAPQQSDSHHVAHDKPKRSGFGSGFLIGIAFSFLLAAYPLYTAFEMKFASQETYGQRVLDSLQMQITLAHKELETVENQLAMIAEAEAKYSALVEQKFDLETSKAHLDDRIAKLEASLAEAEAELNIQANQFDRITTNMRLD